MVLLWSGASKPLDGEHCMGAPVARRPGAAEKAVDQLSCPRDGRSTQMVLMDDVCNRCPAEILVRLSHVRRRANVEQDCLGHCDLEEAS